MYSMGRGERPFAPTNYDSQPINQPDKNRMEINWNDYKSGILDSSSISCTLIEISSVERAIAMLARSIAASNSR